jgi:hypothetical protein
LLVALAHVLIGDWTTSAIRAKRQMLQRRQLNLFSPAAKHRRRKKADVSRNLCL